MLDGHDLWWIIGLTSVLAVGIAALAWFGTELPVASAVACAAVGLLVATFAAVLLVTFARLRSRSGRPLTSAWHALRLTIRWLVDSLP